VAVDPHERRGRERRELVRIAIGDEAAIDRVRHPTQQLIAASLQVDSTGDGITFEHGTPP
jgi:hypothetical protein